MFLADPGLTPYYDEKVNDTSFCRIPESLPLGTDISVYESRYRRAVRLFLVRSDPKKVPVGIYHGFD